MIFKTLALVMAVSAWTDAKPGYVWSFPSDHWAHDGYKTEWWYFTGQLDVDGKPRFGYQFTIFKVGLAEADTAPGSSWSTRTLLMGHAAVTDFKTGEHRFSEVLQRTTPFLAGFGVEPDKRIAWTRAAPGTDGTWELTLEPEGFAFAMTDMRQKFAMTLTTSLAKPIILEGAGGLSIKGKGEKAASLYYSETRLTTRGKVMLDGVTYDAAGESWMDKEFGSSLLGKDQMGWDWFSLQLADGRDLMLYMLRRADGTFDFASGTLVAKDGMARYIGRKDFTAAGDGEWMSPASGARYPAHWRVQVPFAAIDIEVTPISPAQENVSMLVPKMYYWEGAVRVSGSTGGRGFVELTGYGEGAKPAL
ncbi:MAG: carotenoid 1,2-hydratase [Clostridia bacterium]|nr:carotenoid 1,2-hydratase [Deltaproteobacteria bacterium]